MAFSIGPGFNPYQPQTGRSQPKPSGDDALLNDELFASEGGDDLPGEADPPRTQPLPGQAGNPNPPKLPIPLGPKMGGGRGRPQVPGQPGPIAPAGRPRPANAKPADAPKPE